MTAGCPPLLRRSMGCNAWNHPPSCDCGWGGDTGGGGGFAGPERSPQPAEVGSWGRYEAAHLTSFTIPNARCPVCQASVFFYQSEHGGRVFFDPPLGPPWPKHPCTDNRASGSAGGGSNGAGRSGGLSEVPSRNRPHNPSEDPIEVMRRTGWHPLLELKIRQMDGWQLLEGLDPIDNHRCQILARGLFEECAPTFVRVDDPARITCAVEQVHLSRDDKLRLTAAQGWFGVSGIEEARNAKAARSGSVDAMRRYAQSRFYRHLGRDNRVSDVAQFIDVRAASHWFEKAADAGSEEAKLERAFLLDLLDHDRAFQNWREANPNVAHSSAPEAIRVPLAGSLAHAVCVRAAERLQNLRDLLRERQENEADFMDDYYVEEMGAGELYLKQVASRPGSPRLGAAITDFLDRTRVPPFED